MKTRTERIAFFPFLFGDYEGVRAYLDRRAAAGWAFAGRYGLFTARYTPTQRRELHYDVVPADPRRTPDQLQHTLHVREQQGWSPVDTLWGMDVYQSMPCQAPEPQRTPEAYQHWKVLFRDWLLWSLAFLAVTALALWILTQLFPMHWADLSHQWYLSDSRSMLCLAFPLGCLLALGWLGWLSMCLLRRCQPHKPCGPVPLLLRGSLQVLALCLVGLTLVVLWLDQVPRLWLRLALGLLLLLVLILAPRLTHGDRRRQLMVCGGGVFALLLAAMLLSWTVAPVTLDTYTQGSSWRSSSYALLRAEDLDLDTQDQQVTAYYNWEESLFVCQERYHERWSQGLILESTVYHCTLPGLSRLVWKDLLPPGAQQQSEQLAVLSGDGWYQLWYRTGTTVYHLAGTLDWSQDGLADAALQHFHP